MAKLSPMKALEQRLLQLEKQITQTTPQTITPDELYEKYGCYIKKCKDGWLPMSGQFCYQPGVGWTKGYRPMKLTMWSTWEHAARMIVALEEPNDD